MKEEEGEKLPIDMKNLTSQKITWSQIPKSYWDVKACFILDPKIKEFFIKLTDNLISIIESGAVISINGQTATGKRSLAALILKDALLKNIPGMYVMAGELQDAIRQREETEEGILIQKRVSEVGVLVIANFGDEHVVGRNHVIDLVNKRHLENKLTILVSVKNLERLYKDKYSKDNFDDILNSCVSIEPAVHYCNQKRKKIESILFGVQQGEEQECLPA